MLSHSHRFLIENCQLKSLQNVILSSAYRHRKVERRKEKEKEEKEVEEEKFNQEIFNDKEEIVQGKKACFI